MSSNAKKSATADRSDKNEEEPRMIVANYVLREDLVHVVHQLGYHTGIDLPAVARVSLEAESLYGATCPGKMHRVIHRAQARVAS